MRGPDRADNAPSMGGFSLLALLYHFSHPGDRPYRHLLYLVALALLGLILVYHANRTKALAADLRGQKPGRIRSQPRFDQIKSRGGGGHPPRWIRCLSGLRRAFSPKNIGKAIFLAVLAFVAISALAAHLATTPQRHLLASGKTPGQLGVAFENVCLPAHGDSVRIAGWYIPSEGSRRAIVLVHGKDASRTRELDRTSTMTPGEFPELAVGLSRRGFAVLMIDLRGQGESGPARFGFGRTSGETSSVPWIGSSLAVSRRAGSGC